METVGQSVSVQGETRVVTYYPSAHPVSLAAFLRRRGFHVARAGTAVSVFLNADDTGGYQVLEAEVQGWLGRQRGN